MSGGSPLGVSASAGSTSAGRCLLPPLTSPASPTTCRTAAARGLFWSQDKRACHPSPTRCRRRPARPRPELNGRGTHPIPLLLTTCALPLVAVCTCALGQLLGGGMQRRAWCCQSNRALPQPDGALKNRDKDLYPVFPKHHGERALVRVASNARALLVCRKKPREKKNQH